MFDENSKIKYFYLRIFLGKLFLKIQPSEITSFFYNFFPVRGRGLIPRKPLRMPLNLGIFKRKHFRRLIRFHGHLGWVHSYKLLHKIDYIFLQTLEKSPIRYIFKNLYQFYRVTLSSRDQKLNVQYLQIPKFLLFSMPNFQLIFKNSLCSQCLAT